MRAMLPLAVLATLVVFQGCGGPRCERVQGTVKYLGRGVADVNVVFYGSNGIIGRAVTDSEGNFNQVTWKRPGDGLPAGEYKVTITPKSTVSETEDYSAPPPPPFPKKYLSLGSSDLRVTVAPGSNNIVIELKD